MERDPAWLGLDGRSLEIDKSEAATKLPHSLLRLNRLSYVSICSFALDLILRYRVYDIAESEETVLKISESTNRISAK